MKALFTIVAFLLANECLARDRQDRETVYGRIEVEDSARALAVTIFISNHGTNAVEIIMGNATNPLAGIRPTFFFPPSVAIQPSTMKKPEPVGHRPVTNVLQPRSEWRAGTFIIVKPPGWEHKKRLEPQLYLATPDRNLEYIVRFAREHETEQGGTASGRQPSSPETNRTP
jgi:hypothetical protein